MKSKIIKKLRKILKPLFRKDLNRLAYHERFVPLDHFYSPMVVFDEASRAKYEKLKNSKILDINLRDDAQLTFLNKMIGNIQQVPWQDDRIANLKYHFVNRAYSYHDAITYLNILLEYKPMKVIEIGSGYSSCVLYDVDRLHFSGKIEKTFIEPYPKLLKQLLSEEIDTCQLIPKKLEDLDVSIFESLEENDILFVDSTHVSKYASDLNFIMFEILPRLKKGVVIHFHDIFTNFEYPFEWLNDGRCWNENYILRAFLMNNTTYEVLYFNNYMGTKYQEIYKKDFPLAFKNIGGSIWLKKVH